MGHFSDALREMSTSIVDLEDRYFKALHKVFMETEQALWDVSRIDAHYVSQVVMVMSAWQEVVQTIASHMEGVDTTIYLACREDLQRVTQEYVAAVVKAREECNTTHAVEQGVRRQALQDDDHGDPIVCLLSVTRQAAHAQCEKAVDAFLSSIEKTLRKHVPPHAQGPLISNALSTTFQFQMSVWRMIGKECIRPVWAKHTDWCGLAGIVQAIVKTFPKNCALMFPPAPPLPLVASFSNTFRPQSSDDDNDDNDDGNYNAGSSFCRFDSSLSTSTQGDPSATGQTGRPYTSTPLLHGGAFHLSTDPKEPPSSSLGAAPDEDEERGSLLGDDNLDMGQEADDEEDGEKDLTGDEILPDPSELELLQGIMNPAAHNQLPPASKSGDKRGPSHLDGGSASSDSSVEDLDAKGARPKKKGSTPTKAPISHPSQWGEEDIDVVRQTRYKTDLQRFQTYHRNKIDLGDMASINTKDHSAYIEVARADPGSVIRKSIFSVAAYREVLKQKGGDVSRFDKEVESMFKKGPRGSQAPDATKVPIRRVILVCQRENGVNVKYSDSDGFGRPGTMGLWDLHSSDALNWVKMQLPSGSIDANFCPCCAFYSTNNETLNNHVRKHYGMGLTCRSDGFTMASMATMKGHMETEHGYKGKCTGAVKKPKGKG